MKTEVVLYEMPKKNKKSVWYLNINSFRGFGAAFYLSPKDLKRLKKKLEEAGF